ncbi:MAG: SPFH domain-containing protein [Chloroflexi bacterium]|nr:SPFH domain-containing protein [Chloroflexota bacterium]MCI0578961.1 SPFH domain-containing protein [Chloroflexota bacterium]MCI0645101.1 SPFH domain-containing protein [Chloroflexota bacterium]MCI0731936.1 SPFH domain-containing protein [Chloroflexota bacterium]
MFGISYLKSGPTQYIIHHQNGRVKRSGVGVAFFYYRPSSSIAVVPVGSADVPFIFNEVTADFQPVTVQGQLTYRVTNPTLVASLLNYTVDGRIDQYLSDDPEKLSQRLVNLAQVYTRAEVGTRPLREAIRASDEIVASVLAKLATSEALQALGVEIITFTILAIKPTPEIARALEAEAREMLLREADLAIYDRRNSAVEQERRIKENELNTEIAVEEKKRQIRETQAEANLAVEAKEQQLRESKLAGQIKLEEERKQLVTAHIENARAEADAQSYAMEATLRPLSELDETTLQLLAVQSADPRLMVSLAMKEIAQNAAKIGQLNITPDLLEALLQK